MGAINEVGVGRKALKIAVPFIFFENGNPHPYGARLIYLSLEPQMNQLSE